MSYDVETKVQQYYGEALKKADMQVSDLKEPSDVWKAMYYVLCQITEENIKLKTQVNNLTTVVEKICKALDKNNIPLP